MTDPATHFAKAPIWAVVGASNASHKYGNRIYLALRRAGYTVYAVNDKQAEIEGDRAYARLVDLPEAPTVVGMVIPPERALPVVCDAIEAGSRALWFQPGSESAEAASLARDNGLVVIQDCILVHLRRIEESGQD